MKNLSVFYFICILFTLLSIADPSKSTSRRLLVFGRRKEKKSLPSSPPKYARSSDAHGLTVYIRPQTANELGRKVRSYTHLLKSKLYTNEEKAKLKHLRAEKKKRSSQTTKTQELVTIQDDELNRCKSLLQINGPVEENEKPIKQKIASKVKNLTQQAAKTIKNIVPTVTASTLITDRRAKGSTKTHTDEKKISKLSVPSVAETNEKRPFTSRTTNPPPLKPPSQSTINKKSETITIIEPTNVPFDAGEDEIDDKNTSVVGRAYHFMKNVFQLSDDTLDEHLISEDQIIDLTNEPQHHHHHHSRKLLSLDETDTPSRLTNEWEEVDLDLNDNQIGDSPLIRTSLPKRQLLSVKPNKHSTSSKGKKEKPLTKTDGNKPKVGWAYRYRISRYLEAQKMKRKSTGERKSKAASSSTTTKGSKRKLLEYHTDDDEDDSNSKISDQTILQTVSITEYFLPKRQLLTVKNKTNYDQEHREPTNKRRRKKSIEELTDPIAIVQSYDRGTYKPRVGWQFRYRVSRYIDSLRENIREDQERLKLGLQAIKRKTPQELSGRRKRVLDKPVAPDSHQAKKQEGTSVKEQNKPDVGWRYRYRISKMLDEKKKKTNGENIDGETEKHQARLPKTKKTSSRDKPPIDVKDEPIPGEENLDPELRKINNEGRRVGWAFRYRIRRKLDYLKQQQTEMGISFDLATLSGKREKKPVQTKTKSTEKKTTEPVEEKAQNETKSVGWKYRYRVSKMHDAQEQDRSKVSPTKKHDQLDTKSAPPSSNERNVGWEYRYRIRRKLDSPRNAIPRENTDRKRAKKSKRKSKEKLLEQVEESIGNILNIDDIDQTPFMEYVRRASSYIFLGFLPAAKRKFCRLRLPVSSNFCNEPVHDKRSVTTKSKRSKKLKTKKEHRAKQFIHSHRTKFGVEDKATERRVDETMRRLYKKPSLPPLQTPPLAPTKQRKHPPIELKTHDEERESTKKMIAVDSKKNKNKKQFQIIGQEVTIKHKHFSPPSTVTTRPPPIVETPVTTTATPRLRTISEVIREEAVTILASKPRSSKTPEEIQAKIDETNEIIQEQGKRQVTSTTTTTTIPTPIDSTTSGEEDNESSSTSPNDNEINQ